MFRPSFIPMLKPGHGRLGTFAKARAFSALPEGTGNSPLNTASALHNVAFDATPAVAGPGRTGRRDNDGWTYPGSTVLEGVAVEELAFAGGEVALGHGDVVRHAYQPLLETSSTCDQARSRCVDSKTPSCTARRSWSPAHGEA